MSRVLESLPKTVEAFSGAVHKLVNPLTRNPTVATTTVAVAALLGLAFSHFSTLSWFIVLTTNLLIFASLICALRVIWLIFRKGFDSDSRKYTDSDSHESVDEDLREKLEDTLRKS